MTAINFPIYTHILYARVTLPLTSIDVFTINLNNFTEYFIDAYTIYLGIIYTSFKHTEYRHHR